MEEAIRRRDSLIARQMAAEAQKEVQGVSPAFDKLEQSFAKFEHMERKVESMEAEAAAVVAVSGLRRELDKEYEQAMREAEVESELVALKLKMQKKSEDQN